MFIARFPFQRNRKPALFGEIASSASSPKKFAALVQIALVSRFQRNQKPALLREAAQIGGNCNSAKSQARQIHRKSSRRLFKSRSFPVSA
ncbi:MAG: hypothetical protein ACI4JZ_05605, partial [Oscillospiraceae bacterium]